MENVTVMTTLPMINAVNVFQAFFGFPNCQGCQCNLDGTIHDHDGDHDHDHGSEVASCSATGQCACKDNIAGDKCDQCASGYSMNGFPACQKEIRIKFHVINALYNKGIESMTVKATGSSQGLLSEVTDAGGF